jgi:hypothetical protein
MLMGKNGDKPLMMMFIMVYLGTFWDNMEQPHVWGRLPGTWFVLRLLTPSLAMLAMCRTPLSSIFWEKHQGFRGIFGILFRVFFNLGWGLSSFWFSTSFWRSRFRDKWICKRQQWVRSPFSTLILQACLGNHFGCSENVGNPRWNNVAQLISRGLNAPEQLFLIPEAMLQRQEGRSWSLSWKLLGTLMLQMSDFAFQTLAHLE